MTDTVSEAPEERASTFESNLPLEAKLEQARTELLDLSARNRLLNIPNSAKSVRVLEIVDEQSAEVHRLLIREQRAFTFLPGKSAADTEDADAEEIAELAQPDEDGVDARGVANRHIDTKLQTRLTPPGLQKRLLDLYYDARTLEEEQGVNILFLALGTLKWIDPNNAANIRYAPLVLVPAQLERGNAAEKFKLRWRQEDPAANLSLEAYLDRVHGMKLPVFEAGDDFDISAYFEAVREAVQGKEGWEVNPDHIVLGFFSFAKFLMYRDLDPATWPTGAKLSEHAIVKPLLSEGFPAEELLLSEDDPIDEHIAPAEMVHIVDSDSSQTRAVHEVRAGRNLVIQGPPGTGKSQTIANIIASAVADGKRVLFVAEKMAALEVVKRRLDNTGVGDACLELHSNKANKRAVLEDLRRTWELGAPRGEDVRTLVARLSETRDVLNAHAERLHQPMGSAGLTPYEVVGHLTRLKQDGQSPTDVQLEGAVDWTREDFRQRRELLAEVAERVLDIGVPANHVWRGVELTTVMPTDVDRLEARLAEIASRLDGLIDGWRTVAARLECDAPEALPAADALSAFADRVAGAPDLEAEALGSSRWATQAAEITELLATGERLAALAEGLSQAFTEEAWSADLAPTMAVMKELPGSLEADAFEEARRLGPAIASLREAAQELAAAAGRSSPPATCAEVRELITVAERVATAPTADPAAFAADLWDTGVERAADLATAVAELEQAREGVGNGLSEAAWSADLTSARQVLAAHGDGVFKIFSGEWRGANRRVRSFLTDPKAPLQRRLLLLDALAKGQRALSAIAAEEEFGRSAFAADWRGERSSSAPLLALVEWMRSLKGLGAEPRIVAGRTPDRRGIEELGRQADVRLRQVSTALEPLWERLGGSSYAPFADVSRWDSCALDAAGAAFEQLVVADDAWGTIARQPAVTVGERLDNLTLLAEGQELAKTLAAGEELGSVAFGAAWQREASDWARLKAAGEWISANLDIHELASRIAERSKLADNMRQSLPDRDAVRQVLAGLLADICATSDAAIDPERLDITPLSELAVALKAWLDNAEQLSKWVAYRGRFRRATEQGMGEIAGRMQLGSLAPEAALPCFEMSYFECVFAAQVKEDPELLNFDGDLHSRTVSSFVDLDRERIRHAAIEVVRAHHRSMPPATGGAAGPLGVLKAEIARKRGHMPIRKLMQNAGPAVQALKPVFMMSPLSVAQFLPPGEMTFDLLVMDEASQIQPVDALGAIARCRQVVVVGDPQQLPPTAFFAKMTGSGDSDDDDGGANVADIESILGLFTARGLPLRMLRWHYRSRHESLIAVSNRQFYENKLVIVPSPFTRQAGLGLRFHHIKDGIFESGTTRTNPVEAKAVAKAIVEHALEHPKYSLGVVAFSAAQRRAILDQLEILRRQLAPEQEAFFQSHPAEPFFVKNLENVQGDERDVIFISVGYGPTVRGAKPPMRFGPLGQEGGERRLNVLISRAKRRCEIFSSMTDEDIEPDFASTRKGVFAFKLFMHFARTGRMSLAESAGQDQEDVFETQVAQALHALGYQVHRNVGVSGLFVDIAIADPERPDRYILAIECDGPSYRSAKSARDRDRLRRSVLEDHGWIVHRIWCTDWFKRPKEQLERTVKAIEAAKVELESRTSEAAVPDRYEIQSVERDHVTEMGVISIDGFSNALTPYVEAQLKRPSHLYCELHDAPTGLLASMAEQVVAVEGPVYVDEVVARIRDAWGLRRAGSRIQDAVGRALAVSTRQKRLHQERSFYSIPGTSPVVRDRSAAASPGLRKPEALPPSEIAAGLIEVVGRNFGATADQAILAVSRAVGFKATSTQLRETISGVLDELLKSGILAKRDTLIDLGPNAPAKSPLESEPTPLDALIGEGEHECLEFKQTLRWDVRQQAVNKKLEDVVIKTIAAFANHRGGTLLIGVRDDGGVDGLDQDLQCTGGNRDKFELHLNNLLNSRFNPSFRATKVKTSFPAFGEKTLCRLDVQRSRSPVYVTLPDQSGAVAERLYVRSGNASQEIPPSQIVAFVKEHFDNT